MLTIALQDRSSFSLPADVPTGPRKPTPQNYGFISTRPGNECQQRTSTEAPRPTVFSSDTGSRMNESSEQLSNAPTMTLDLSESTPALPQNHLDARFKKIPGYGKSTGDRAHTPSAPGERSPMASIDVVPTHPECSQVMVRTSDENQNPSLSECLTWPASRELSDAPAFIMQSSEAFKISVLDEQRRQGKQSNECRGVPTWNHGCSVTEETFHSWSTLSRVSGLDGAGLDTVKGETHGKEVAKSANLSEDNMEMTVTMSATDSASPGPKELFSKMIDPAIVTSQAHDAPQTVDSEAAIDLLTMTEPCSPAAEKCLPDVSYKPLAAVLTEGKQERIEQTGSFGERESIASPTAHAETLPKASKGDLLKMGELEIQHESMLSKISTLEQAIRDRADDAQKEKMARWKDEVSRAEETQLVKYDTPINEHCTNLAQQIDGRMEMHIEPARARLGILEYANTGICEDLSGPNQLAETSSKQQNYGAASASPMPYRVEIAIEAHDKHLDKHLRAIMKTMLEQGVGLHELRMFANSRLLSHWVTFEPFPASKTQIKDTRRGTCRVWENENRTHQFASNHYAAKDIRR